jgi:hypothetical protein
MAVTGPAAGKLPLKAKVFLLSGDKREKVEDAMVYVHLRGYARARVTHLDIEHRALGKLIHRGKGDFLDIEGFRGGIIIHLKLERQIELEGKEIKVQGLAVSDPILNEVLKEGETTRTWVGRKFDGIYIGFRRNEIAKLEGLAARKFGARPLEHLIVR